MPWRLQWDTVPRRQNKSVYQRRLGFDGKLRKQAPRNLLQPRPDSSRCLNNGGIYQYQPPRHNLFIICNSATLTKMEHPQRKSSQSMYSFPTSHQQSRHALMRSSMPMLESIRPPPCTPDLETSKDDFRQLISCLERGQKTNPEILKNFVQFRKDTHSIYIQRTNTFS